ncbi:multidrug ABC transporter ATP-binding protein [Candidatus Falkowbacteria bacterium RIFOXYB2_FULL_34_18]|uniref:Multidrug ABC transporter ATP-binding protein n=1 Tax=Candidatus Falkowbacteria bacterium RIFOXYD2_FULL_34_120 TaxID=1798007 RepID=A0A1F5TPW0_9BACT|nr:MAG: multidrug ABC transporter ATP-binding protein [Candidatus Falkowbacteria bacterium RIFOXYB2_FULL_34_18]OGF29263.1 MAG: multidrug ABC transporter ATP-binding protein [Candidatus Falkowbacteria bacterium RIFOXYC12_FULL_34_55]OGF36379.1 MAG: multidrug ABC transporter ATP-binding protein [Candidatus Falkowbacteria bacterium RIFOXYC2_FULL_34_220]OGF38858.1 MAG: multidrug ABC transporter ATP-binding protein [Candidatus Falkowbacteria bacterium RIFOXYD12_FULL_34_57]OGF40877.1 MAG: multidrug AB
MSMSSNNNKKENKAGIPPMRGPGHMIRIEKAKDFKSTMKNLIFHLKPFWISLIAVIVFAFLSTAFNIMSPKILGNMTNQIVSNYMDIKAYDSGVSVGPSEVRPGINFDSLSQTVLILSILYLLSALFGYIQGWLMAVVAQKITYDFRRAISKKINRLPLKYFDSKSHGDILSRVINDIDTLNQTLNQGLTQIVTAITTLLGILIMMFWISWLMTLVALLLLPLSMGVISVIIKKSQKYFKRQQDSLGRINGHIEEMYSGHHIVKVFNGKKSSLNKFRSINNEMYDSAWKAQFLSGLMWPLMSFFGNLGYVGVSVFGGFLAYQGRVNIGDIQAFIQYTRQFNQPIIQAANVANVLQSTAAAAERVFEFLSEAEEIPDIKNLIELSSVQGRVEFRDVIFGYETEKPVIKGLNVVVEPGKRIAIVGPTGAGKTTIVNLLLRFYDIQSGAILVDGIDIRRLKRAHLRRLFGMVLQDAWLFNGTIKENIAYGFKSATEEKIIAAAEAAHADQFIRTLPGGYNMELNEETDNISQGEKQLLTIARVMLIDPPILILDEATSSVDTRTEVLIQKAMNKLMAGRTSFVIAHRLSTIRNADMILVINNGNIIEQGKHEELISRQGFYTSLYNSQFALV